MSHTAKTWQHASAIARCFRVFQGVCGAESARRKLVCVGLCLSKLYYNLRVMLLMAHRPQGEGSTFSSAHSIGYSSSFGYATRPVTTQKRPCDMDSLKMAISQAIPGTGQVKRAITDATFQPRAPAFTSLIQTCAKFRQVQKAIEIFDTMATSEAIDVKPNTVHYRCLLHIVLK